MRSANTREKKIQRTLIRVFSRVPRPILYRHIYNIVLFVDEDENYDYYSTTSR